MAKQVFVQQAGKAGITEVQDCDTVGDVREKLELGTAVTATINGEPAEDDTQLRERDYVGFAKATAGGR